MGKIRKMTYNGNTVSVEDTVSTARLLINGNVVDWLLSPVKWELKGLLPSGELVRVQVYGLLNGKFRLIIGERVITEDW